MRLWKLSASRRDFLKSHSLVFTSLVIVTLLSVLLAVLLIWRDRNEAIERASERAASLSRLIIAHAEAAVAVADRIISVASPPVSEWDLIDSTKGAEIAALLQNTVGDNNVVASIGIIDSMGNVVATSRSYPPKPLNIAERPFFRAHRAGSSDPIVMGDPAPGPISGQKRFTFSRAIRNPDGSIKAVLSAAIQTASFDALYREVAKWPGEDAGLYGFGGDILAQVQKYPRDSRAFLMDLEGKISKSVSPTGTLIMRDGANSELISWSRSAEYPHLYSATSDPMGEVLRNWYGRVQWISLLVLIGNVLLWYVALIVIKTSNVRRLAEVQKLSTREIHHRLKNSLQLISSLIRMRSAKEEEPRLKHTVEKILIDLQAVAEIHGLLQELPSQDGIDLAENLKRLIKQLENAYQVAIKFTAAERFAIAASHATAISIIINELVTNAVKHGGGNITVNCFSKNGALFLEIQNDRGELPENFRPGDTGGFGLRAVDAMVKGFGGELAIGNRANSGVRATISIPLHALHKN